MNLLMKGAALAPPFSCTTKYSSDVYSPRPPDIRVRLLPTKPPVHFTTEQPGRDSKATEVYIEYTEIYKMDIFIIHYLPERHENTPYRHEWANRRSLYIELNCSSTIYSGEKLG